MTKVLRQTNRPKQKVQKARVLWSSDEKQEVQIRSVQVIFPDKIIVGKTYRTEKNSLDAEPWEWVWIHHYIFVQSCFIQGQNRNDIQLQVEEDIENKYVALS